MAAERRTAAAAPPAGQSDLHSGRQTSIWNSNKGLKNGAAMTRPSEVTRERIMKAAERLFAERGYDGTSIRAIVAKARVNQAAINYHFAGKDGLYREVLRAAFRALTEHQLAHADEAQGDVARGGARPSSSAASFARSWRATSCSRHMRIFNWETVRPTAVFRKLLSEEAAPFMGLAIDLVRRFLPEADHRTLVVAAIWLIGQCSVFVRNREQFAGPPVGLALDESLGRMAGPDHQPLGDRRSGASRLEPAMAGKTRGMPQKFLFPGQPPPRTACLKFNRPFEKLAAGGTGSCSTAAVMRRGTGAMPAHEVPLLVRFLGKLVLDILPAALASVIGGFLFTQYHFGHAAAPQPAASRRPRHPPK